MILHHTVCYLLIAKKILLFCEKEWISWLQHSPTPFYSFLFIYKLIYTAVKWVSVRTFTCTHMCTYVCASEMMMFLLSFPRGLFALLCHRPTTVGLASALLSSLSAAATSPMTCNKEHQLQPQEGERKWQIYRQTYGRHTRTLSLLAGQQLLSSRSGKSYMRRYCR